MTLHLHNMMCIYACVCIYNIWHMLYTAFWTGLDWRFYVLSSEHRPKGVVPMATWKLSSISELKGFGEIHCKICKQVSNQDCVGDDHGYLKSFRWNAPSLASQKTGGFYCPIIVKCQSESRLVWRSVCHGTHVKESNSSTNHHASFVPFATKMPLSTRTFGSERTCGIEVVQSQRQAASFSSYKVSGVNIVQAFVVIRPQTSNNCDWIYSNHWSDKLIARDHFRTWCERIRKVAGRQNPNAGDHLPVTPLDGSASPWDPNFWI